MKVNIIIWNLLLILFLTSCEQGEMQEEVIAEEKEKVGVFSVQHETGEQNFEIIPLYESLRVYIEKAREAEDPNLHVLYMQNVFTPNWDKCFREGEYLQLMNKYINKPPANLDALERLVDKMAGANLEQIIKQSLIESAQLLSGPDTNVCILPYNQNAGGLAVNIGAGKITIFYDDNFYRTEEDLAGTVAHEYHHSVWTDRHYTHGYTTLLEYMIFEGRAESFKHRLYPTATTYSITQQQEETSWAKIVDSLDSISLDNQKIILGGGEFPRLYGYAAGFNIMQDFLNNNPEVTIDEWTALSPEKILEKSNYVDRFK
ncbi:DUF2268 domain-containing putative Zn-dependent protease [Sutcliffiella rhizosphaerae]|uniref:DUF2268 domain-containing protein n=1 Tax=Sutcliffiella rhizosphaerae TaxID=2880967 RepID=A0ABM8YRM2_9BACI|nr:DUF2268 domain-containing putative Zn-dependent protease [Sutcliffiella rhizosphaerae]CAG9622478.1 hypothetical protein BACCIP111883_03269 [Sutcliffiella rhizosphaerae]